MNARFIRVESEHSAMAAVIGAAAAGVRTFTATSSQGLALMHEMLHWAAGARLPIVMADVNRAMAPGWNIWADQTDSALPARHRLDPALLRRRAGGARHDPDRLSARRDGEPAGHGGARRVLPLPHLRAGGHPGRRRTWTRSCRPGARPTMLDPDEPHAFGQLTPPEVYMEIRLQHAAGDGGRRSRRTGRSTRSSGRRFGRSLRDLRSRPRRGKERGAARRGHDRLRRPGPRARRCRELARAGRRRSDLVKLKLFRPFPRTSCARCWAPYQRVAVLDRNISRGTAASSPRRSARRCRPALPRRARGLSASWRASAGATSPRRRIDRDRSKRSRRAAPSDVLWADLEE